MAVYPKTERVVYPDEPYYHAPATIRLLAKAAERSSLPTALAICIALMTAAFALGWWARGLWGPVVEQRGWAALIVLAIVLAAVVVNDSNRRAER